MPMPLGKQHRLSKITIGPNVVLYSELHFFRELSPMGFTLRGFRRFLRALSVPTLEIGGQRYIDHLSFSLALRAILRVGERDFLAPGSTTVRRYGRKKVNWSNYTEKFDTRRFHRNFQYVIAELLASRRLSTFRPTYSITNAAKEAARRMLIAGIHHLPLDEQAAYSRMAVKKDSLPDPFSDLPPAHAPPSPIRAPQKDAPPPQHRPRLAREPLVATARVGRPRG